MKDVSSSLSSKSNPVETIMYMLPRPARQFVGNYAGFFGPTLAGLFEVFTFHPVDTMSKRLMTNKTRVGSGTWHTTRTNIYRVLFPPEALNRARIRTSLGDGTFSSFITHVRALYPGVGPGLCFKIAQRVLKFGGQPILNTAYAVSPMGKYMTRKHGELKANVFCNTIAGTTVGLVEPIFTPFDNLKIKYQTNPGVLRGRSLARVLTEEKVVNLYRGFFITVARNGVGSTLLFLGSTLCRTLFFTEKGADGKYHPRKTPTFFEFLMGSTAGSVLSLTVGSPLDVLKTRVQNTDFDAVGISAVKIAREMITKEGYGSFFKGIVPKLCTTAPKVILSFTLAQYFALHMRLSLH